jgi:hypothetical protein
MHTRLVFTQTLAMVFLLLGIAGTSRAELIPYLDEGDYLAALAGMSLDTVHEGFENDSVWGTVRTIIPGGPNVAPSITSQGITWTSNNTVSNVTTSSGAAVTGSWGFYSLPHGDFSGPNHADDVPDGFRGFSAQTLIGVGGWIQTNTPFAGISLFLDSVPVDFGDLPGGGDPTVVGTTPLFFGVIDSDGFNAFLWQETEGTFDDQKFIFADDFTFAVGTTPVPEPSSFVLFGMGAIGLFGYGYRRKRKMAA